MAQTEQASRDQLAIPGLEGVLGRTFPPSLKWDTIGQAHTLTVADGELVQDRDFDSGEPLEWEPGRPKMIAVLIGTDENGADASVWIRGRYLTKAYRDAMRAVEVRNVAKGDVVTITRTQDIEIPGTKPKQKPVFANGWECNIVPVGVK
jgi:hypothetical protein